MSEATTIELIKNLPAILTACGTLVAAICAGLSLWQSRRNGAKVDQAASVAKDTKVVIEHTRDLVNSRMDEVKAELAAVVVENSKLHKIIVSMSESKEGHPIPSVAEAAEATANAAIDTVKAAHQEG